MIAIFYFSTLCFLSYSIAKTTYFNLDVIYGPYCNPKNTYTPDAGLVRYAGTPWAGKCELNLYSCCSPVTIRNMSHKMNVTFLTKYYIRLLKPPLCSTEDVTIVSETGEKIFIDCNTTEDSEYYVDGDRLTIIYDRREKFPISSFTMIVTPLKMKTRVHSLCGFDCFTDTYCIDRSLVCDRFRNCPNNIDETQCESHNNQTPISFQMKVVICCVLLTIILFDIGSLLFCHFCCGAGNKSYRRFKGKRNTAPTTLEEGAAAAAAASATPLLETKTSNPNN